MAAPTVFVSSTFYDLRYVREALKRFIESLGYVPVLSEDGTVFYDPVTSAADSCFAEVLNAEMFVLIIGGRHGSQMPNGRSVTNTEYEAARRNGVPIFAMVEQGTYNDYSVYRANAHDPAIADRMVFPNADTTEIFGFIDRVQGNAVNNALVPFRAFGDVESYLRNQWAGMMHQFLRQRADGARVSADLNFLAQINERIEVMTTQILRSVGTPMDRLNVSFLQRMLVSTAVSDLRYLSLNPRAGDILRNESLSSCASAFGREFFEANPDDENFRGFYISSDGEISPQRLRTSEADYQDLRTYMLARLAEQKVDVEEFLTYEAELTSSGPGAEQGAR